MEVLFCSASLCSIEFVGHLHGPWGLKKDMICVRRSWRDSCSKSVHVNRRRRRKTCNNKDRWSRVSVVNKVELESDIIYHIIEHLQHYWAIGTQLHTKSPLFNIHHHCKIHPNAQINAFHFTNQHSTTNSNKKYAFNLSKHHIFPSHYPVNL